MFVHKSILFTVVLCLSACGFAPLYGPHSSEGIPHVEAHLAHVKIAKMPGRTGQILHNHLRDKLNPSGEPHQPEAHLDVAFTLDKVSTSLRRDGTTQRFNLVATARISLWNKDKKKILYQDTVRRTASFSIGDTTAELAYASTVSENDARKRALLLVAEDMHLMLATYYKKWPALHP